MYAIRSYYVVIAPAREGAAIIEARESLVVCGLEVAAAVVYDALAAAKARRVDHLIVDTAGRLHNKDQLMAELAKRNNFV